MVVRQDNKIILHSGSISSDQPQGPRIVDVAKKDILSSPSLETRKNIGSTSSVISVTNPDFSKANIEDSVEYFANDTLIISNSERNQRNANETDLLEKKMGTCGGKVCDVSEIIADFGFSENELKDHNQQPLMSFSAYTNHDVSSNISSVPLPKYSPPECSYSTVLDISSDSSLTTNSSRSSDEEANHGKKSELFYIIL